MVYRGGQGRRPRDAREMRQEEIARRFRTRDWHEAYMTLRRARISDREAAKLFDTSARTLWRWLRVYESEHPEVASNGAHAPAVQVAEATA